MKAARRQVIPETAANATPTGNATDKDAAAGPHESSHATFRYFAIQTRFWAAFPEAVSFEPSDVAVIVRGGGPSRTSDDDENDALQSHIQGNPELASRTLTARLHSRVDSLNRLYAATQDEASVVSAKHRQQQRDRHNGKRTCTTTERLSQRHERGSRITDWSRSGEGAMGTEEMV